MAMLNPIVDPEQERITDQLAQAAALRKQMFAPNTGGGYQGGKVFMVGSPLGNVAQALAGQYLHGKAMDEQQSLSDTRNSQLKQALAAMPGYEQHDAGVRPDAGGRQPARHHHSETYQQVIDERQKWAAGMGDIHHPLAQAISQSAMLQAITAPQREAEAAQKAEDRLHELKMKAIDARATQAERLEAQKEIARMNIEGRQETARLVASLKASSGGGGSGGSKADMRIIDTVDEDGNAVKKVIDLNAVKAGETFGKPAKPPTKEEIAQGKLEAAPGRIDQILEEAAKNKGAFGIVPAAATMLPDIVGSRVLNKVLTDDEQKARVKVQTQAAKVIHDIYGAALSRGEAFRAELMGT